MKYFYKNNEGGWGEVPNRIALFLYCSIFGTVTWCQEDCQEEEKHSHPNDCPQRKTRKGLKESFTTRKGVITTIAIGTIFGITINKCVFVENFNINVWEYENVQGSTNNKNAKFRVAIVTQEYRWKIAKTDSIETGSISTELPNLLNNLSDFGEVIGLVSVGCASQEGTLENEIYRAERRADNVLTILKQHRKTKGVKNWYKLNLGQYSTTQKDKKETSVQRRVIIIGILEKDNSMNGQEVGLALQDALQKSSLKTTVNIDSYSNFDFSPMQNE